MSFLIAVVLSQHYLYSYTVLFVLDRQTDGVDGFEWNSAPINNSPFSKWRRGLVVRTMLVTVKFMQLSAVQRR